MEYKKAHLEVCLTFIRNVDLKTVIKKHAKDNKAGSSGVQTEEIQEPGSDPPHKSSHDETVSYTHLPLPTNREV